MPMYPGYTARQGASATVNLCQSLQCLVHRLHHVEHGTDSRATKNSVELQTPEPWVHLRMVALGFVEHRTDSPSESESL